MPSARERRASPRCCAQERASLEAGPALRRIYSGARGEAIHAQLMPLGFVALPDCLDVQVGGVAYRPNVCDLGPESVAGWLSALAARDLPVEATVLDADARELLLEAAASRSASSNATS